MLRIKRKNAPQLTVIDRLIDWSIDFMKEWSIDWLIDFNMFFQRQKRNTQNTMSRGSFDKFFLTFVFFKHDEVQW